MLKSKNWRTSMNKYESPVNREVITKGDLFNHGDLQIMYLLAMGSHYYISTHDPKFWK